MCRERPAIATRFEKRLGVRSSSHPHSLLDAEQPDFSGRAFRGLQEAGHDHGRRDRLRRDVQYAGAVRPRQEGGGEADHGGGDLSRWHRLARRWASGDAHPAHPRRYRIPQHVRDPLTGGAGWILEWTSACGSLRA